MQCSSGSTSFDRCAQLSDFAPTGEGLEEMLEEGLEKGVLVGMHGEG